MSRKSNKQLRKSSKGGFWPFSSNSSQPEQLDASGNPVKKGFFSKLFGNSSSKQEAPAPVQEQKPLALEAPLEPQQPPKPIENEKKPEILGGKRRNKSNKKSKKSKKSKTMKSKK